MGKDSIGNVNSGDSFKINVPLEIGMLQIAPSPFDSTGLMVKNLLLVSVGHQGSLSLVIGNKNSPMNMAVDR